MSDWTSTGVRRVSASIVLALALLGCLHTLHIAAAPPLPSDALMRTVDVNTAPAAALQLLPMIGPKRAAAIVKDRDARGPYRTLDDLQRVHGIGPRTVKEIEPFARTGRSSTR
ncbi:MAG: helix-hairpin-helix domain-containing protein [Planctomycetota bacterium]